MKNRILIIDKEPRWSQFVKDELEEYEIRFADNIREATAQLKSQTFDIVIASSLSINELEQLKNQQPDVHIIVVTVHPKTQEALQAYRMGASRYLAKSFGHNTLAEQVKDLLLISDMA